MTETANIPSNPYVLSDEEQLGGRASPPDQFLAFLDVETSPVQFFVDPTKGPFFLLFASDLVSPSLVKLWADLMLHDTNCPPDRRQRARRIAHEMEQWQRDRLK